MAIDLLNYDVIGLFFSVLAQIRTYDSYTLKVNLIVFGGIPASAITLAVEILGLEYEGSSDYNRHRLLVRQQH